MNRKQLYNEITSLGLQEEVKSRYGKDYTHCTNVQLEEVVKEVTATLTPVSVGGEVRLSKLIEILAKKKILLKSEVEAIMNV